VTDTPLRAFAGPTDRGRSHAIVIGLGNPILSDDGVGWRVIDELERRLRSGTLGIGLDELELERACVGGVALMEALCGYRRAIVVDAIFDTDGQVGDVWCRSLGDVLTRTASHLDSSHDAPLSSALAAGRALGAALPDEIDVVGVVIKRSDVFGDELSGPVAAAVAAAADLIVDRLEWDFCDRKTGHA
jgi:hydrogenase maturation protease